MSFNSLPEEVETRVYSYLHDMTHVHYQLRALFRKCGASDEKNNSITEYMSQKLFQLLNAKWDITEKPINALHKLLKNQCDCVSNTHKCYECERLYKL